MENKKSKVIVSTFNLFQFFGWAVVLNLIVVFIFLKFTNHETAPKVYNLLIIAVKLIQTLQITDIIFSLLGMSGSSLFSSLAQVVGRLVTAHLFLNYNQEDWCIVFVFLVPWSLADTVRSIYYVHKESKILGHLRYNMFIVLYPIGVAGEILLMEKRMERDGFDKYLYIIRSIEAALIIGLVILYTYLLKQRSKFYKGLKEESKTDEKKVK
jgi:very-long-chain (3R)-3-hydroxyacyl-CoA dehydratase